MELTGVSSPLQVELYAYTCHTLYPKTNSRVHRRLLNDQGMFKRKPGQWKTTRVFLLPRRFFFLDIKHPCIFNKQSRECRGPTAPVKQTKLIVKSNQPDALPIWKRGKQIPPAVFTLHGNDCSPLQEKGSGKAVFWCEIGRPQCSKNLQIPCEKVFRHPKPTPKILAEGIGA